MQVDSRVLLGELSKNNPYMHKNLKDQTTSLAIIQMALRMATEEPSPPDKLIKPLSESVKLTTKEGIFSNIVRIFGGLVPLDIPTVEIYGTKVPVNSLSCQIFKAVLIASVTPNEDIANEVVGILPNMITNLVEKKPLYKGFLLKDLTYFQKEVVRAVKELSKYDNGVQSYTAEDIAELANSEIVVQMEQKDFD